MKKDVLQSIEFYNDHHKSLEELLNILKLEIREMLNENRNEFSIIEGRVKDKESYKKKCHNPKYESPILEIHDLIGIRIVTSTTAQVKDIISALEHLYKVDYLNSENKLELLGEDRFGYLSNHLICQLWDKEKYSVLKLNKCFFKFEIQVRTLIQHAWAQLSHDNLYKFEGHLNTSMKRKFYQLAGLSEILDEGISNLKVELYQYKEALKNNPNLQDLEVNLSTLDEFFGVGDSEDPNYLEDFRERFLDEIDLIYIKKFGITKISEFQKVTNSDIYDNLIEYTRDSMNISELIRYTLLIDNPLHYKIKFNYLWPISEEDISIMREFKVEESILNQLAIDLVN
jgi:ppGpp synthetase/RelA/SpoT-type nucleotidyltranferase